MNERNLALAAKLVPENYVRQAQQAKNTYDNLLSVLLEHRKIPENGWSDLSIEMFLTHLSSMDSNNFLNNCGAGEREARIASNLVAKRHYHFGHGIGRSGDLLEPQPKAAGSSLLQSLTNSLVEDLFISLGMDKRIKCIVVPIATSFALTLSMLTLGKSRPNAKYVLWSRIDQKACFKSIITAGLVPIVIDTFEKNSVLFTDLDKFHSKIQELGPDNICCILSTTSCFAPRLPDTVEVLAEICKEQNIPHLINNAYGVQDRTLMKLIRRSNIKGRVDVIVQSTDKNFLVPVGGAVIASFNEDVISNISSNYPGRASITPILDVFITLLHLGKLKYLNLVMEREQLFQKMVVGLNKIAEEIGEEVISNNPISIAFTLNNVPGEALTQLGSMLFVRNISGSRVITTKEDKSISNFHFKGWGCHTSNLHVPYLTVAVSIGMRQDEVDKFLKTFRNILTSLRKTRVIDNQ